MRKIIFTFIALLSVAVGMMAQGRDTIIIRDTVYIDTRDKEIKSEDVAKLIPEKSIGRFDRGILNYRLIEKGKWMGGLTFSFINYESEEGSLLYSMLGDFDANFSIKAFNPYVGYAIKDNTVVGVKFGYNRVIGDLGNIDLNLGSDMSFSIGNMRYSEDLYSIGLFHRSYIGLDSSGMFGLFNETHLTYKRGHSNFTNGKSDSADITNTETTINELRIGINPGVAVFITKNVSAEMSFGVAGFKYRSERQNNSLGEEGKRDTSGADFKINILNINIGLTFCL